VLNFESLRLFRATRYELLELQKIYESDKSKNIPESCKPKRRSVLGLSGGKGLGGSGQRRLSSSPVGSPVSNLHLRLLRLSERV
jgi:hypothetical protein